MVAIGRKHVLRCFHPFRTLSTGTWKENASQLLDVENAETALYLLEQFFGLTNLSKLLLPGLLLFSSSSPEQIQFPWNHNIILAYSPPLIDQAKHERMEKNWIKSDLGMLTLRPSPTSNSSFLSSKVLPSMRPVNSISTWVITLIYMELSKGTCEHK